jgi:hypothetical protein
VTARKWVPLGVAALALVLLGYGAYAFFGDLRAQGETPTNAGSQRPMIGDKKRPKAYALPEFPTAHAFLSADDGTQDRGSAAFSVRKGTAKEIAAFYRKALAEEGWKLQEEKPAKQRPGTGAVPNPPTVTGLRQEWLGHNGKRRLRVLALDFIQLKSTAQVVLSWSPAAESGGGER